MKKTVICMLCIIVFIAVIFSVIIFCCNKTVSTVADKTEIASDGSQIELSVTKMYSYDGKVIYAHTSEAESRQQSGWYTEPNSLMQKLEEDKSVATCVTASRMESHRLDGWFSLEYNDGLFSLGQGIKEYMKNKSGSWGIYIKNLDTNDTLILNDGKYSSASIIKLFVMAGLYNETANGNMVIDDNIRKHLNAMITVSDNYSSNYLVKSIGKGSYFAGFNAINSHNSQIGCINSQHMSLFIGHGDYVAYGKNLVSPVDCGILLEKIYRRELVSSGASEEMLSLLKNQTRRSKIPYYLPNDTVCANKTGETSDIESDVGIVYSPNCDYIICVITNDSDTAIYDIRQISLMTYNYFNPVN